MFKRCTLVAAVAALTLSLFSSTASAEYVNPGFEIGFTLMGSTGAVFLNEPDDQTVPVGDSGFRAEVVYPGFGGVTFGYGLALDLRYGGVAGVEVATIFSTDRGAGEINEISIEIGQRSVHVPILFKLMAPSGDARPFLTIGYQLVLAGDAEATHDSDLLSDDFYEAEADNYGLLAFGLGLELRLPTRGFDMRIPIQLRAGIDLDTPEGVEGRADYRINGSNIEGVTFISEWQYHVGMTIGLSYFAAFGAPQAADESLPEPTGPVREDGPDGDPPPEE